MSRPATECAVCGAPATWQAFIVFRDLPPMRAFGRLVRPRDTRCREPVRGACNEHQHHADDVTGPDMLRSSWPELAAMVSAAGLPVPPLEKATVQWERVIENAPQAPPSAAGGPWDLR